MFFDLVPLILFFIAFQWASIFPQNAESFLNILGFATLLKEQVPILLATLTIISVSALQMLYLFLRRKTISKMFAISFVLLLFFGALTFVFHDPDFIKMKPSVLYLFFAAFFLGAFFFKKNPLKKLLGQHMELPHALWQKLNLAWFLFFLGMAMTNYGVAVYFSTSIWVNFKLFGALGLTFLFVLAQGFFLSPYFKKEAENAKKSAKD